MSPLWRLSINITVIFACMVVSFSANINNSVVIINYEGSMIGVITIVREIFQ